MDEEFDYMELIQTEFQTPDLMGQWQDLLRRYREMGFTDPLTDSQRIEEFTYIVEQVRKYIFSKEKSILSYSHDLNKMLAFVDELISKAPEKSLERKTLVYYALRDEWLVHLRNDIWEAINNQKEIGNGW